MRYSGRKKSAISFPLGGIGSGSIGLSGNGVLTDWEIFNRPSKGSYNGISHFAVRAEDLQGNVQDIRLLNSDLPPDYMGHWDYSGGHRGFGYGPSVGTLCNFPHFKDCVFDGNFPVARLEFSGAKQFPGIAALTAWSVMIPGESKVSSLPAAFFEIEIKNNTPHILNYTAIGVLSNPWITDSSCNRLQGNQLTVSSGDGVGDMSLTLLEDTKNISGQNYLIDGCRKKM